MIIEYIGHACFFITNNEGKRIIIDPYDHSIGLKPVDKTADIVLITHDHYDHNFIEGVSGDYERIDAPGKYTCSGVKITGLEIPHDDEDGDDRGMVTAFVIETDHMRLLHMSDVGTIPDDSFFDSIGRIDILMIPVGGTYTIDSQQAHAIMNRIEPNITIPMHYKTKHLNIDIDPINIFIDEIKREYDISRLGSHIFEITADNLKKRDRVLVMENSY